MCEVVVRRRCDFLCQTEPPGRHSHEVYEPNGDSDAYDADALAGSAVEETALAKALSDCGQKRTRGVPNRSFSIDPCGCPMVIEASIGMWTPSSSFVPPAVGAANTHKTEPARKDRDRRRRGQVPG